MNAPARAGAAHPRVSSRSLCSHRHFWRLFLPCEGPSPRGHLLRCVQVSEVQRTRLPAAPRPCAGSACRAHGQRRRAGRAGAGWQPWPLGGAPAMSSERRGDGTFASVRAAGGSTLSTGFAASSYFRLFGLQLSTLVTPVSCKSRLHRGLGLWSRRQGGHVHRHMACSPPDSGLSAPGTAAAPALRGPPGTPATTGEPDGRGDREPARDGARRELDGVGRAGRL